jgi:hypothetical protein
LSSPLYDVGYRNTLYRIKLLYCRITPISDWMTSVRQIFIRYRTRQYRFLTSATKTFDVAPTYGYTNAKQSKRVILPFCSMKQILYLACFYFIIIPHIYEEFGYLEVDFNLSFLADKIQEVISLLAQILIPNIFTILHTQFLIILRF